MTVDFAHLNKQNHSLLRACDTDSNHTPKEPTIVRGGGIAVESSRSKASIVREIEKVTKFTEADIRASWKLKELKAKEMRAK